MGLKYLLLILIISFSSFCLADSIYCSIDSKPEASSMKIDYENDLPINISMKPQNSNDYQKLNVEIDPVFVRNEKNEESFIVRPIQTQEINWDNEPFCFKEIGTLWYFIFRHDTGDYAVQFVPHFAKNYETCYLPRFTPQTNRLSCSN